MITKWLLKNGFGSPGQTSKVFCERYNYYYATCDGDQNEILKVLYGERMMANLKQGNATAIFHLYPIDKLISLSGSDFAFFIFVMMCIETNKFRENVSRYENLLIPTVEIMHESVQKYCPKAKCGNLGELLIIARAFSTGFKNDHRF